MLKPVISLSPDGRTDRWTDRIPIANTRSQQYLLVQLSRVKSQIPVSSITRRKHEAGALFAKR